MVNVYSVKISKVFNIFRVELNFINVLEQMLYKKKISIIFNEMKNILEGALKIISTIFDQIISEKIVYNQ